MECGAPGDAFDAASLACLCRERGVWISEGGGVCGTEVCGTAWTFGDVRLGLDVSDRDFFPSNDTNDSNE